MYKYSALSSVSTWKPSIIILVVTVIVTQSTLCEQFRAARPFRLFLSTPSTYQQISQNSIPLSADIKVKQIIAPEVSIADPGASSPFISSPHNEHKATKVVAMIPMVPTTTTSNAAGVFAENHPTIARSSSGVFWRAWRGCESSRSTTVERHAMRMIQNLDSVAQSRMMIAALPATAIRRETVVS